MKRIYLLFVALVCVLAVSAQPGNFVKWSYTVNETGNDNIYNIIFDAVIDSPWHMYDLGPYEDGPNATAFEFEKNDNYRLTDGIRHNIEPKKINDPIFMMELGYFASKASFVQTVEVLSQDDFILTVAVEYQLCDDQSCLMPTEYEFEIPLKGTGKTVDVVENEEDNSEDFAEAVIPADEKKTPVVS